MSIASAKRIEASIIFKFKFPTFATLGTSWNFSQTEILARLCLQDGVLSGITNSQPAYNLMQILTA